MNWRFWILWAVRLIAIGLAVWLGRRWLDAYQRAADALDSNAVINSLLKLFGLGIAVLALFFLDIVRGVGTRVANLILPEVDDVEVRPQHSVAEARAREGRYEEAIVEFRKVLAQHPNDVNAQVRIAEILAGPLHRPAAAAEELRAVLRRPVRAEAWAFVANRLVDVEVEQNRDFVAAREVLQQVMLTLPGTKYSEAAEARVVALNRRQQGGKSTAKPPLNPPEPLGGRPG